MNFITGEVVIIREDLANFIEDPRGHISIIREMHEYAGRKAVIRSSINGNYRGDPYTAYYLQNLETGRHYPCCWTDFMLRPVINQDITLWI
jgi:hypothetical protein